MSYSWSKVIYWGPLNTSSLFWVLSWPIRYLTYIYTLMLPPFCKCVLCLKENLSCLLVILLTVVCFLGDPFSLCLQTTILLSFVGERISSNLIEPFGLVVNWDGNVKLNPKITKPKILEQTFEINMKKNMIKSNLKWLKRMKMAWFITLLLKGHNWIKIFNK